MGVLSGFKRYMDYIMTDAGYMLTSRWTSASSVQYKNGLLLEDAEVDITLEDYEKLGDVVLTNNVTYNIIDADGTDGTGIQATNVAYNNSNSDMTATNTQSAIDELNANFNGLNNALRGGVLSYNSDTDWFGMTYNGVWKNVLFAGFKANWVYCDGEEVIPLALTGWSITGSTVVASVRETSAIRLYANGTRHFSTVATAQKVDVTNYKTANALISNNDTEYTLSIPINNMTGEYYISIHHLRYDGSYVVYLELNSSKSHDTTYVVKKNQVSVSSNVNTYVKRIWLE